MLQLPPFHPSMSCQVLCLVFCSDSCHSVLQKTCSPQVTGWSPKKCRKIVIHHQSINPSPNSSYNYHILSLSQEISLYLLYSDSCINSQMGDEWWWFGWNYDHNFTIHDHSLVVLSTVLKKIRRRGEDPPKHSDMTDMNYHNQSFQGWLSMTISG